jgi:uncharacterized protein
MGDAANHDTVLSASVLSAAETFARTTLSGEPSGHDWWHAARVRALARAIAEAEHADGYVCELAALLHDIADPKIAGDWDTGLSRVRDWLTAQPVDAAMTARVLDIIATISFDGGGKPAPQTLEGRVVQDADRLDAIGAIGIARAFAYGGAHGRVLCDPEIPPRTADNPQKMSAEAYRQPAPTINHFHEKMLLLKERMNTGYARRVAEQRHHVMESFLAQFYGEWNGER